MSKRKGFVSITCNKITIVMRGESRGWMSFDAANAGDTGGCWMGFVMGNVTNVAGISPGEQRHIVRWDDVLRDGE
jgi:hypothetical protein